MYKTSMLLCLTSALLAMGPAWAQERQEYRVKWEEWKIPPGTVEFKEDGTLIPTRFETNFNAALNASEFTHILAKDKETQGGIWRVGSTASEAGISPENLIDGDPDTYWKPDPNADLSEWWVELDLGRAVPVSQIRLVFPDTTGARPLREFRVMGSDGKRRSFGADLFTYEVLGGTTQFNDQSLMEVPMRPLPDVGNTVLFAEPGSTTEYATDYRTLQYIRIRIDSKSEDAAIAELEAFTFGSNFSLGTLSRGGQIVEITGRGTSLIDADFNTTWAVFGSEEAPTVWILDLGAFVWVDRILQLGANTSGQVRQGFDIKRINDHRMMVSDGSLKLTGLSGARTTTSAADLDYKEFYRDDDDADKSDVQYIMEKPQAMRYIAAIYGGGAVGGYGNGDMAEIMVIPRGHVAKVEVESNFIDLGEIAGDRRAKQIESITWDAIQPEGTTLEVRTRTGHQLSNHVDYYSLAGELLAGGVVEWEELNKFVRGATDSSIVAGDDWSAWSVPYASDDQFLSPSPRRYVQIQLIMSSNSPDLAAEVRSLDVNYSDAIIRGVEAEITPKQAEAAVPTTFTYKMWGDFSDPAAFDRLLFSTPSLADIDSLVVRIGGIERDFTVETLTADSLVVLLAEPVTQVQDTVEVQIRVQINRNPTVFNSFVGHTDRPGLWQAAVETDRVPRATQVFLPAVPTSLLGDISVSPGVVTPNGDRVGDQGEIRFRVFNVGVLPEVTVHSLDGRLVNTLRGELGADGRHVYTWSGENQAGDLAPPGLYLYRIDLDTQKNEQQIVRTIGLAY